MHESLVNTIWPTVARGLFTAGVIIKADKTLHKAATASTLVTKHPTASQLLQHSTPEDYTTEFLNLTIAAKVVASVAAAIEHINTHSSRHTDSIVTENEESMRMFCRAVDSAGTYVNASTRFADGFRYGFGTEVGVSTGKTHARGPVGLEGLVIYKYQIRGQGSAGHITAGYGAGPDMKKFRHQRLQVQEAPF